MWVKLFQTYLPGTWWRYFNLLPFLLFHTLAALYPLPVGAACPQDIGGGFYGGFNNLDLGS